MSPFDRVHMTSYWRSIVTMALSSVISEIFNVEKCRDLEIGVRSYSRSLKVAPFGRSCVVSYQCSLVTLFLRHTVFDIWLVSIQWCWNPGYGSLKVIENYTLQSGTHDFLLTFHNNHRPISHRFRDKRQYPSKIANFSHPHVFNSPAEGFP